MSEHLPHEQWEKNVEKQRTSNCNIIDFSFLHENWIVINMLLKIGKNDHLHSCDPFLLIYYSS